MNLFEDLYEQIVNEAYRSPFEQQGNFQHGDEAEQYFAKVAHFNGYAFQVGSSDQDRKQHIDGTFFSPHTNKRYTVEIKAKKSAAEHGCGIDNFLIELRSRGGLDLPGWLYGRANFIAFMYEQKGNTYPYDPDIFILINRQKLQEVIEKETNTKWIIEPNGIRKFVFDEKNLVNNTCAAMVPKLYHRAINDPSSIITRIPLQTLLGSLQKNTDYFILKFIEAKNIRELKSRQEDINKYKNIGL
jgi:hypothetical protein